MGSPKNLIDLTGKQYDNFIVLRKGSGRYSSGGQYKATWICKCTCGKEFEADGQMIRTGRTHSCGCLNYKMRDNYSKDLSGERFGKLVVVRRLQPDEIVRKRYIWLCRCDCGNYVHANAAKLKSGSEKSCGCLKEEYKKEIGNLNRKYVHSDRRMYCIYRAMLDRCYNPNCKTYKRYGGRGIKVCDEWNGEYGFDNFYEWAMSNGYSAELSIDRIDVNKNYTPLNCRWITNEKQQNNKRTNIFLEYKGETKTLKEWSRELSMNYSAMMWRYKKYKMGIEEMINDLKERT